MDGKKFPRDSIVGDFCKKAHEKMVNIILTKMEKKKMMNFSTIRY